MPPSVIAAMPALMRAPIAHKVALSKVSIFLDDVKTVFGMLDPDGSGSVSHDEIVQNTSVTQKRTRRRRSRPRSSRTS